MSLLGLDSWVVRSSEPIAAEVGDGLVMLSVQEGKYFSLNPTAAAIWRRLESPMRVGELCDQIVDEFDISREHAIQAVPEFVAKLIEQKIVATPVA
jgi:hypothetical protein